MDAWTIEVLVREFKGNLHRAGLDLDEDASRALNGAIELAIAAQTCADVRPLRAVPH